MIGEQLKTVLKVDQKVEVFKSLFECETLDGPPKYILEGTATLVKLVCKHHNTIPAYETWMVKFDDDGEAVQRDIRVKLPPTSGMASSLARSPEGKSLLAFMVETGLSNDWADPSGHGITAYVNGKVLNNEIGASEFAKSNQINDEILVYLEHGQTKVILNLNTLLVLASSYVRQQYGVVAEAIENA